MRCQPAVGSVSLFRSFLTYSRRIMGLPACSYSWRKRSGSPLRGLAYLGWLAMEYSMFDCPEASHTSPTSTSPSSMRPPSPLTLKATALPEARSGASLTLQRPSAAATALPISRPTFTFTSAPGVAVPHTLSGLSHCSTMQSVNTSASFSLASAARAISRAAATKHSLFIFLQSIFHLHEGQSQPATCPRAR